MKTERIKEVHRAEEQSLVCGNAKDTVREVTREEVLGEIQKLLEACYKFGVNPLPGLRKCFPAFEWRFESYEDRKDVVAFYNRIRVLLQTADFFWSPTEWIGSTLVWARHKVSETPLRICATKLDTGSLWDRALEEILGESNLARR